MACDAATLITLAQSTDGYGRLSRRDLLLALAAVYCVTGKGWDAPTAMVQAQTNQFHKLSLRDIWNCLLKVLCGSGVPIVPPTNAQWSAFQFGANTVEVDVLNAASAPCPSWNVRFRVLPASAWTEIGTTVVASSITFGASAGNVVQLQARWEGCSGGSSDWSVTQTITMI